MGYSYADDGVECILDSHFTADTNNRIFNSETRGILGK